MAKFIINEGYVDGEHTIEAESYSTNGDFIDFVTWNAADEAVDIVFRIAAKKVDTVKRVAD
jgi:hypothetical protein